MNASLLYIWHFDFEENCVGYLHTITITTYDFIRFTSSHLQTNLFHPVCLQADCWSISCSKIACAFQALFIGKTNNKSQPLSLINSTFFATNFVWKMYDDKAWRRSVHDATGKLTTTTSTILLENELSLFQQQNCQIEVRFKARPISIFVFKHASKLILCTYVLIGCLKNHRPKI